MPARLFRAGGDLSDEQLARIYAVPVEKVADRRRELAVDSRRPRVDKLCADLHDEGVRRHVADPPTAAAPAGSDGCLVLF